MQDLPQYHFWVKASGKEGQLAAPLRLLDISHVDQGLFPDKDRVAEACRRLTKRAELHRQTQAVLAATIDVFDKLNPRH